MARTLVGHLSSLWRYPVKSMQGEALTQSDVDMQGLVGDRAYALWDVETSRIASAKNPKKWAALLDCAAKFERSPQMDQPMPTVHIALPNGTSVTSEQPDIDAELSTWINREVHFLSSVPDAPSLDQYWPDVDGTAQRETITQLFMPPGTFFDSCSIHGVTTATLNRLQELYPEGAFDPCRFRPNLLIEPPSDQAEFVENDWVGHVLGIGETVRLQIDTACPRCVVTTLAQNGLPQDLDILRTTAQYNDVIAGIRMSVLEGGVICTEDPVWLETL